MIIYPRYQTRIQKMGHYVKGIASGKRHVFSSSNPRGRDVDDVESYDFWALYNQSGNQETDSMPTTGIDAEDL